MKKYNLTIKEEAKKEIIEAYRWYENKQSKLGDRFVDAIDEYFSAILLCPKMFPVAFNRFRKAVVRTFPYIIVFEIEKNNIVVYAVFQTKQNPKKIKSRK